MLNWRAGLCSALAVIAAGNASLVIAEPLPPEDKVLVAIQKSISHNWKLNGKQNIDLSLTFDLSSDGAVYGLTLQKGFVEPLPIATAIHALVVGMPYVEPGSKGGSASAAEVSPAVAAALPRGTHRYQCNITGCAEHPDINVTPIKSIGGDAKQDLGSITKVDTYKRQLFINGPQYKRFVELLDCRYRHPDDAAVKAELDKLLPYCGLDPKIAHHWIGFARSEKARLKIEPQPNDARVAVAEARLASLLESWRLGKREIVKLEIENAYRDRISLQLLSLPETNPLLLGNAAFLTGQLRVAQEQYKSAVEANIVGAQAALEQLKPPASDEPVTELVLNENYQPVRDGKSWKKLLSWLPLDMELLVIGRSDLKAAENDELRNPNEPLPMFFPAWPEYRELEVPDEPGLMVKDPAVKGRPIANVLCLHSARSFSSSNIDTCGVGTADAIDIAVFPKGVQGRLDAAFSKLRQRKAPMQVVKGVEVFRGKDMAYMGQSVLSNCGFFCQPVEGVLLFTSDLISLTEVLERLRTQPDSRAFPDTLPEWTYVDTNAEVWGLRHYDTAYVPFDSRGMYDVKMSSFYEIDKTGKEAEYGDTEIGMTFSRNGKRLKQSHLSNNKETLEGLKKYWNGIYNYDLRTDKYNDKDNHGNPKITLESNVVTADGEPTTYSPLGMMLLVSMGYFVSI